LRCCRVLAAMFQARNVTKSREEDCIGVEEDVNSAVIAAAGCANHESLQNQPKSEMGI
jgi:hypothetical protein